MAKELQYDFSKEAELPGKIQYDFSTLPMEMQQEYMLYLPITDIANYCSINPHVANICRDDYFWYKKVNHDFNVAKYKPEDITYQQQFLDLLSIKDPNTAAKDGRMDILLYLESKGKLPNHNGYIAAIKNGHVNVLEWLKSKDISTTSNNIGFPYPEFARVHKKQILLLYMVRLMYLNG